MKETASCEFLDEVVDIPDLATYEEVKAIPKPVKEDQG